YGLAISFYPIYLSFMLFLISPLMPRWKIFFDPFLLNSGPSKNGFGNSAEFLNSYVMNYTPEMIGNRVLLILIAIISLTVLYVRFRTAERTGNLEKFLPLGLSTASDRVFHAANTFEEPAANYKKPALIQKAILPSVIKAHDGFRSVLNELIAASDIEFRLLLAERSLFVIMPLAIVLSNLEVAFYNIPPDVSHSAAYATNTAKSLLLFLLGIIVFYAGEAMHRDRDVRVEAVLWAAPAPNIVLLLSKFLAVLSLTVSLIVLVGLAAIIIQLLRGHTPVDLFAYLSVYSVILLPSI